MCYILRLEFFQMMSETLRIWSSSLHLLFLLLQKWNPEGCQPCLYKYSADLFYSQLFGELMLTQVCQVSLKELKSNINQCMVLSIELKNCIETFIMYAQRHPMVSLQDKKTKRLKQNKQNRLRRPMSEGGEPQFNNNYLT